MDTLAGREVGRRLAEGDELHLATIEVVSVVRGWVRGARLDPRTARQALVDLTDLQAVRYADEPFVERIWQLRENLSAYDAAYVALAEALNAPLVTCDARLARAAHGSVEVVLVQTAG